MDEKLEKVISGYTHQDYKRVVDLAAFYRQIVSGVGYGDLIKNYKPRESDPQKKQRVRITQVRTKHVAGKIIGFYERIYRTDKLKLEVHHEDEEKRKTVTSSLDSYGNDGESVLKWSEETALFLNNIDPNAFCWVKNKVENGKDNFSPFIFYSESVKDFDIEKGKVKYAICELEHTVSYVADKDSKRKTIKIFYYFRDSKLMMAIEYNDDIKKYSDFYKTFDKKDNSVEKHKNGKNYLIHLPNQDLKNNPISRVGYNLDEETNGRTYVSLWDLASELYKILVSDGSVFDVSKALHGFPKMVVYYTPCKFIDSKTSSRCVGGNLAPKGGKCPSCHGTGEQIHISAQDVIKIQLPTQEQPIVVSPKDLIAYADQPFQFMDMQKALIDEATPLITEAVFGVDLAHKSNSATTATEVINFFDTAQNKLYSFTKAPSRLYKFTVETIADYKNIDGISVSIEYPDKYNIESEEYLLDLLKKARDADAPPEVLENLFKRLALKQNRSGDISSSVYEAMRKFMPFEGLDKDLKQLVLLDLPFSDLQRSLLINFKEITERIISEHKQFTLDDYKTQRSIVYGIAQEFADETVKSNSVKGIRDSFLEDANNIGENQNGE